LSHSSWFIFFFSNHHADENVERICSIQAVELIKFFGKKHKKKEFEAEENKNTFL
jgi:hypothetical protein